MRLLPNLAVALVVAATPALARERCDTPDPTPGLKIEFHFGLGDVNDPQMDEQLYQMQIKQKHGIDARSVRVSGDGCLEAFVQAADGSWGVQYYDPDTFERVN
ncbi:hypothetical protein PRN20_07340 [Devosia sp. ZB163]|uniref:hypothetical protein n=1 Tax=Devosia sp. ZB163 TaxID=3025938 RepID=UPI00236088B3|nr:hypothetical protein [Devosia sp. ZB163]MDC9823541.1 hypothetical protein [Devosia sp. ZB163]